mmetsp:Transcript_69339/g.159246  ORF Transcript_69339/g.159246 Transcript_69339/m.159246 type:complete len:282 (+) Transcript_69339:2490-3335(+)
MEESRDRSVLSRHLHHLLGQHAPEEGGHGLELHSRHHSDLANHIRIHLNLHVQDLFRKQALRLRHNRRSIRSIIDLRHPSLGALKAQDRRQAGVVLQLYPEIQHIHPDHIHKWRAGVLQHLAERLGCHLHPHLLLSKGPSLLERRKLGCVPDTERILRIPRLVGNLPGCDCIPGLRDLGVGQQAIATLDIREFNIRSIRKRPRRLPVRHRHSYESVLTDLDICDEPDHRRVSILVHHHVLISQIHKHGSKDTAAAGVHEGDGLRTLGPAEDIPLADILQGQ